MTQTGYTNAIVNAMLGWLKGLANWVLKLFNLSGGFSPLKFLADNWLRLLVFFLILGVVIDLLVWLIRWRPHWVWFRKKRVIINDKNFFVDENEAGAPRPRPEKRSAKPRHDWVDSDFVVPSAARRRREEMEASRRNNQETTDIFQDGLFNVNAKQKFSDKYEDEVFSVKDLPKPERAVRRPRRQASGHPAQKPRRNTPAGKR